MDQSPSQHDASLSSEAAVSSKPKWSKNLIEIYDPHHPERRTEGLVWAPGSRAPPGYAALRAAQRRQPAKENSSPTDEEMRRQLCWACGWTNEHQKFSSYTPRVNIFHTRQNMGLWTLAGQWMLRDQPNDASAGNDVMTQRFLRAQPGHCIPLVPDMIELNGPDDTVELTLMRQARGTRLYDVWPQLSAAERGGFVRQMAAIIQQLRQFTAPSPQKVDGTLLDDFIIYGYCHRRAPACHKIGSTEEAWLDALEPTLRGGLTWKYETRDPDVIEAKLQELRASFPSGGPYYLTHGDLNLTNIIVLGDKIEAIVDWERAGYYPWWAERYLTHYLNFPAEELFDLMWDIIEPELDIAHGAYAAVANVNNVYKWCTVEHPGEQDSWLRPAFSACEPMAGRVRWRDCGNALEHKVSDVQWRPWSERFPDPEVIRKLVAPRYTDSEIEAMKKALKERIQR